MGLRRYCAGKGGPFEGNIQAAMEQKRRDILSGAIKGKGSGYGRKGKGSGYGGDQGPVNIPMVPVSNYNSLRPSYERDAQQFLENYFRDDRGGDYQGYYSQLN